MSAQVEGQRIFLTLQPVSLKEVCEGMPLPLQGCNLALESCRALDAALGASACDLDAAPKRYSDARLADAHAFQDLEVMQVQPDTIH